MSAVELPNERLIEILSSLSHRDLKKCERVSKTFRSLIRHAPSLAAPAFRTRRVLKPGEIASADDVKLHPIFGYMLWQGGTADEHPDIIIYSERCGNLESLPLMMKETAAAKENATEPATNVLQLQIYDWGLIKVRGKDGAGVTVKQVGKALRRLFETRDEHGERTLCEFEDGYFGWAGFIDWNSQRLDNKGRLVLEARYADDNDIKPYYRSMAGTPSA